MSELPGFVLAGAGLAFVSATGATGATGATSDGEAPGRAAVEAERLGAGAAAAAPWVLAAAERVDFAGLTVDVRVLRFTVVVFVLAAGSVARTALSGGAVEVESVTGGASAAGAGSAAVGGAVSVGTGCAC
ncbi:MAG: hypothetical protein ACJ8FB_08505 [Sphingomicrobium sp.]